MLPCLKIKTLVAGWYSEQVLALGVRNHDSWVSEPVDIYQLCDSRWQSPLTLCQPVSWMMKGCNSDCCDYLIMFDVDQIIFYFFKAQIQIPPTQWRLPWLFQSDYISPLYIPRAVPISTMILFFEAKDCTFHWIVSSLWVYVYFYFPLKFWYSALSMCSVNTELKWIKIV